MTLSEEMEATRKAYIQNIRDNRGASLFDGELSDELDDDVERATEIDTWLPKVKMLETEAEALREGCKVLEATAINKVFTKAQFKLLAEAVWRMKIAGMLSFDEEGIALKLEDILAKWSD